VKEEQYKSCKCRAQRGPKRVTSQHAKLKSLYQTFADHAYFSEDRKRHGQRRRESIWGGLSSLRNLHYQRGVKWWKGDSYDKNELG
jgi:hypothetical protein